MSKKRREPDKRTIEKIVLKPKVKWPEGIHESRLYWVRKKCEKKKLRGAMIQPLSMAKDGVRVKCKVVINKKFPSTEERTVLLHPRDIINKGGYDT